MWKRLMTRKQQLATDAETARAASQQLRSTVSQLQERLREEGMAKQAAVAVRAELEERLQDAERERDHWQVSCLHTFGSSIACPKLPAHTNGLRICIRKLQHVQSCPAQNCVYSACVSTCGSGSLPMHSLPNLTERLFPCPMRITLFCPVSSQTEFQNQKQIIESQRDLLEQQQQVLRKLAAQKQATMTSEAR